MATWQLIFKGAIGHILLLIVSFSVLVGIIESLQLFFDQTNPLLILNALVLGYMLVHTGLLLSIQLGIQVLEIIKARFPTLLIWYYFKFNDNESLPLPLLDPTKSRLAVLILFLVISGGPILFPIFAVYGGLVVWGYLAVIGLEPSMLLQLFGRFLTWVPPLLAVAVLIIVVSIVMIEFRQG